MSRISLTPNVALFLERLTFSQFTFGEAAWAAQPALSWQTTVVGDPLYRPFGREPQVLLSELTRRHSPLIEWYYLRIANVETSRRAVPSIASFLEAFPTTNSAVLTEKLAGLYAIPSHAIDAYERALTLIPRPNSASASGSRSAKNCRRKISPPPPGAIIRNCSKKRRTIPAKPPSRKK